MVMLRPSTIVIYDELEADHDAEWTWLVHNYDSLKVDVNDDKLISVEAGNELATGRISLFGSVPLDYKLTDQFAVKALNWRKKLNKDGSLLEYPNHWHFKGITKIKTKRMRYLAIIQVNPKTGEKTYEKINYANPDGKITVGKWIIGAELDSEKPGKASFVSSGELAIDGEIFYGKVTGSSKLAEKINGKLLFDEAIDKIPASIKKAMRRGCKIEN
jgi:hypothetical protein